MAKPRRQCRHTGQMCLTRCDFAHLFHAAACGEGEGGVIIGFHPAALSFSKDVQE